MELHALTALQLGEKIRAGEVSPVEAAQAAWTASGRNRAETTPLSLCWATPRCPRPWRRRNNCAPERG